MMIIVKEKKKPTLHKDGLIRGCVYSNVNCQGYFMKVSSPSYKGMIDLGDGSVINMDVTYNEGWYDVEAEVHIK